MHEKHQLVPHHIIFVVPPFLILAFKAMLKKVVTLHANDVVEGSYVIGILLEAQNTGKD